MHKLSAGAALLLLAAPLAAQDYRFSQELRAGNRIEIENINGAVTVTQGSGRTAVVEVEKVVRTGDGSLVKAVSEWEGGTFRVCTIYLNADRNRNSCEGSNSTRNGERLSVEMRYTVRVPSGIEAEIETVNGGITISALDASVSASTVNGAVRVDGGQIRSLETVNGDITANFSRADWRGEVSLETVNGSIDVSLPADAAVTIRGELINGSVDSDFPVTISGRWGPKSFRGTFNGGGNRTVDIETVNGKIRVRKQ